MRKKTLAGCALLALLLFLGGCQRSVGKGGSVAILQEGSAKEYQPHSWHYHALVAAREATLPLLGVSGPKGGEWFECMCGPGLAVSAADGSVVGFYQMKWRSFGGEEPPQGRNEVRVELVTGSGEYEIELFSLRSPAEWFVAEVRRLGR